MKTQTSESFLLSAILSFSGGLQDVYTYNVRGQVFANAQTGNVVLMSQSLMLGDVKTALRYLLPLIAFAAGIFITERIENAFKNKEKIHWRQIVLLIEIAALAAVGFLPQELNLAANVIVSLTCAMQVQSFRKVRGYGYASTMCIGNLRSASESLSQYIRGKDKNDLIKSLHFFGIIAVFAVGAGVGGVLSRFLGIHTIWVSSLILIAAELLMIKKTR